MERWIDELAAALDVERLSRDDVARLLGIARDVAHRVERKITPLAAFVLGEAVGRRAAAGTERSVALTDALGTTAALLPAEPSDGDVGPEG
jgi:hypothetical protein